MKTIELRNHLYKMAEDSTLGWKYSSDHKAYMEMIDYHTGKVYALEHDVFDQEYSKGRRLNPCQIATFQDVPVIGVFDIGYTGDKGRFCHSSIFGRSLSVIPDTIPSLTSNP